jgi:signal transduction histidine kinase
MRPTLRVVPFVAAAYLAVRTAAARPTVDLPSALGLLLLGAGLVWLASRGGLSAPAALALLVLATAIGFAVWRWWPDTQAWIILIATIGGAAERVDERLAAGFALLGYAVFLAIEWSLPSRAWIFDGGAFWPAVILTAVLVIGIQRRRQRAYLREMAELVAELRDYSARLAEAHRQLQAQSLQAAALATAEERNRIARDIHDGLAHALTVIVVQAQAIKLLARSDPASVEEHADTVATLAREGLQEARRSVAALRSEPPPVDGLDLVRGLVQDFGRRAGVTARFEATGDGAALSPGAWMMVYRIVQEALTNAQRHGHASAVDVRLALDGTVRLVVEDDGGRHPRPQSPPVTA